MRWDSLGKVVLQNNNITWVDATYLTWVAVGRVLEWAQAAQGRPKKHAASLGDPSQLDRLGPEQEPTGWIHQGSHEAGESGGEKNINHLQSNEFNISIYFNIFQCLLKSS